MEQFVLHPNGDADDVGKELFAGADSEAVERVSIVGEHLDCYLLVVVLPPSKLCSSDTWLVSWASDLSELALYSERLDYAWVDIVVGTLALRLDDGEYRTRFGDERWRLPPLVSSCDYTIVH